MNGGDNGEVAAALDGPPPLLEWKFSQVFSERTAGEEVQEGEESVAEMMTAETGTYRSMAPEHCDIAPSEKEALQQQGQCLQLWHCSMGIGNLPHYEITAAFKLAAKPRLLLDIEFFLEKYDIA